jgi:hypothetical protein
MRREEDSRAQGGLRTHYSAAASAEQKSESEVLPPSRAHKAPPWFHPATHSPGMTRPGLLAAAQIGGPLPRASAATSCPEDASKTYAEPESPPYPTTTAVSPSHGWANSIGELPGPNPQSCAAAKSRGQPPPDPAQHVATKDPAFVHVTGGGPPSNGGAFVEEHPEDESSPPNRSNRRGPYTR